MRFTCCRSIDITQSAASLNLKFLGGDGDEFLYFGKTVVSSQNPERGRVTFVGCPTTNALPQGSEMGHTEAIVSPSTGAATFRGSSNYFGNGAGHLVCRWQYKRIGTTDPEVPACPD